MSGEDSMKSECRNLCVGICAALQSFGDAIKGCRADNTVLPWAPMLPYVYPGYWNNECRIFYIGRDTYGWDLGEGGFSDFFCKYDDGDMLGYLQKNSSILTTEKKVSAWAGSTGSFWYVVNLLHLRIRLGRIIDGDKITAKESEILNEIGYGNLNAIELPETLQKQECWDDIDKDKYWVIKNASKEYLDRYRFIVEAFSPHVSIITSWSKREGEYFRGMDYEKICDETIGKLKVFVYRVSNNGHDSFVVWTYHPSYLPRIRVGCADFVETIVNVVSKYVRFS